MAFCMFYSTITFLKNCSIWSNSLCMPFRTITCRKRSQRVCKGQLKYNKSKFSFNDYSKDFGSWNTLVLLKTIKILEEGKIFFFEVIILQIPLNLVYILIYVCLTIDQMRGCIMTISSTNSLSAITLCNVVKDRQNHLVLRH